MGTAEEAESGPAMGVGRGWAREAAGFAAAVCGSSSFTESAPKAFDKLPSSWLGPFVSLRPAKKEETSRRRSIISPASQGGRGVLDR